MRIRSNAGGSLPSASVAVRISAVAGLVCSVGVIAACGGVAVAEVTVHVRGLYPLEIVAEDLRRTARRMQDRHQQDLVAWERK